MSVHKVRADLAEADPQRKSTVAGETLSQATDWGAQIAIETAAAEARNVAQPDAGGKRLDLVMHVDNGNCTINAPSGTTFDGTNNVLTFSAVGHWAILESFKFVDGVEYRVTSKHAGATLS